MEYAFQAATPFYRFHTDDDERQYDARSILLAYFRETQFFLVEYKYDDGSTKIYSHLSLV